MRYLDEQGDRTSRDVEAITHLAIQTARSMFQRHVTSHQLDRVRRAREPRLAADVAALMILVYIAGDDIASSYQYTLPGPLGRSHTPEAVLSELEMSVCALVQGGHLELNSSDADVVVSERAMEVVGTAADTLRISREIYASRMPPN
jgi:hypothetical protein